MISEGAANFQATITPFVAAAGVFIAWLGLRTWKEQMRWQQGRGLAVNLLQAFFALQRTIQDTRRINFTTIEEGLSIDEKTQSVKLKWELARDHDAKLNDTLNTFLSFVAEAIVVWNEDFDDMTSELMELKRIASCLVLTGAAAFDPFRPIQERLASSSLYQEFHADFYGTPSDRRGVGSRLMEVKKNLIEKVAQRKIN